MLSAATTRVSISRPTCAAGLTVLYVLIRLLVLFSAPDRVLMDEELYRGNIAKELISGPVLPFLDYQRSQYEGGTLVYGILTVPFFLLFGETVIALKMTGLLLGAGAFILWFLFLDGFFNRKVAVMTSLLLIMPPPVWMKIGVLSGGVQDQINFFIILAISVFYRIFFVGRTKALFGFLGVVCGFSLFFHYSFLPVLLTLVLLWFSFDKKFFHKQDFLIFAAAFTIGFMPWVVYNLTHNFEGFIICDQPISYWLTHNNPVYFFTRIKNVIAVDIPGVSSFADPILQFEPQALLGHWFVVRIYFFVFVLAFCVLSWRSRRSFIKLIRGAIPFLNFTVSPHEIYKGAPLLIFFGVYIIIHSLSGIVQNVTYYEASIYRNRAVGPVYLFIPAIVAIFLYGSNTRSGHFLSTCFRYCGIALLLGLGTVSNLNFFSRDFPHKVALSGIYRGYNYYNLGRVIAWRFDGSPRWVDSVSRIKDAEARRLCYSGMSWGYAEDRFSADYHWYLGTQLPKIEVHYRPYACAWVGEALERKLKVSHATGAQVRSYLTPELIPYFYSGVGREAAREVPGNPKRALVDFKTRIDEEYEPFFYYGLGVGIFNVLVGQPGDFFRFMSAVDKRWVPRIYAGLAQGEEYYRILYGDFGFGIGNVGYDMGKWKSVMNKIEEAYRPLCYQRLGIEAGWRFIHDIDKYVFFLQEADHQFRPHLYRGLGTGIGWRFAYDLERCVALIHYVDQAYWPSIYEGLGIGVARRYAYRQEAWTQGVRHIPSAYRSYFDAGIKSDFKRPGGGRD